MGKFSDAMADCRRAEAASRAIEWLDTILSNECAPGSEAEYFVIEVEPIIGGRLAGCVDAQVYLRQAALGVAFDILHKARDMAGDDLEGAKAALREVAS